MKYLAVAAALAYNAHAMSEIESSFLAYITQFGKSYGSIEEYEHRLRQFALTHSYITEHNKSGQSWSAAHNHMSDWTREEYQKLLGHRPELRTDQRFGWTDQVDTVSPVDWRDSQCVGPIQD